MKTSVPQRPLCCPTAFLMLKSQGQRHESRENAEIISDPNFAANGPILVRPKCSSMIPQLSRGILKVKMLRSGVQNDVKMLL